MTSIKLPSDFSKDILNKSLHNLKPLDLRSVKRRKDLLAAIYSLGLSGESTLILRFFLDLLKEYEEIRTSVDEILANNCMKSRAAVRKNLEKLSTQGYISIHERPFKIVQLNQRAIRLFSLI